MKNKYIAQILSVGCLVFTLSFLTACKDDDDKTNGQIELLSFGPSGVHHGDEITFIGRNMDKVTSVVFNPAVEVPQSAFTLVSKDKIKLMVPQAVESGKVILKTPTEDIESKSIFSLEVPVVISTVTAEAKPGTNITITGEFINWIESITFNSDVVVTKEDFVSQSQDEMVVTVPMEAQTGALIFATGGTEPLVITSEDPLLVTLPTVMTVAPLSVKHAENITITGTDLDLITEISFAGEKVTFDFVSQSETQIVVAVPVGAVDGVLTLRQASPIKITTEDALIIILPKGTVLSPKPAIPGTDNITIVGTDFDLISELTLVGVANPVLVSQFITHTPTKIVLALPATAKNGVINYKTALGYSNSLGVSVLVPTAGPLPLDYYIYDDGLANGWAKWDGWGTTTQDFASSQEVFNGTIAIKVTYNDQYGAIQLGPPSSTVFSGYKTFSFRIYAPAPQSFIVQIGDGADTSVSIPTGWSEVNIPIADMAGNANVGELRFKNNNATLPVTLYIDYVGLKL